MTNNTQQYRKTNSSIKVSIPGLRDIIDIPFPDHKLPVCMQCKSMFRLREQCRLQDGHTTPSWNTSYICVILDDSCFTINSQLVACLAEENSVTFSARSISEPPMPLYAKNDNLGGTKAPFCMACKEKNYTRYHCRGMKNHKSLPFSTVYVLLSAVAHHSKSDGFQAHNSSHDSKRSRSDASSISSSYSTRHNENEKPMKKAKVDEYPNCIIINDTSVLAESDDIRNIELSRAFLMTIENDSSCNLRWLSLHS